MAEELRHAAGHPTYEVREILDGDGWMGMDVLFRCADYGTAVDYAFDFLGRRDPRRTGAVGGLQVIKTEGGRREVVWTYTHAAEETAPDPVRKWGFDVTRRWTGPTGPVVRPTPLARVPRRV
jgi:hypothetical protein